MEDNIILKKKKFKYLGVNVINVKGLRNKRLDTISHCFIATVRAALSDYDIICFHGYVPAYFALITKITGKKNILHLHGVKILSGSKLGKWNKIDYFFVKLMLFLTSWSTNAISIVSKEQILDASKLYKKKVLFLPNGIENKLLSFRYLNLSERKKYFLFVGRIVKGKGIEYAIKAFNLFIKTNKDYELIIVGDNVLSNGYYTLIKKLSEQNEKISFIGFKSGQELHTLYREATCVLFTSEFEASPVVLMEAIALNGIILANDIPAVSEVLGKEYIGKYEYNNYLDLCEKMNKLIIKQDYLEIIFNNSKTINLHDVTWEFVAKKYLKLYKGVYNNEKTNNLCGY